METKNTYKYPVDLSGGNIEMTYDKSPVHKGPLKNAVDFICPEGTPVVAVADGVIVAIKSDSDVGGPDMKFYNDGNYIIIEHQNGEYSSCEHLRCGGVVVELNQKVKKGELIGYSGATGYTANLGPHIHLGVGFLSQNKDGSNKYEEEFVKTLKIRWAE